MNTNDNFKVVSKKGKKVPTITSNAPIISLDSLACIIDLKGNALLVQRC
jgi:hypothetical protein